MATTDAEIVDLLDQILNVLAIQVAPEQSITERARLLKRAGLDNRRIATLFDTSAASVATMTSNLRRNPR